MRAAMDKLELNSRDNAVLRRQYMKRNERLLNFAKKMCKPGSFTAFHAIDVGQLNA